MFWLEANIDANETDTELNAKVKNVLGSYCHALACILCHKLDPQDFVDPCFTSNNYCATYSTLILPVQDQAEWELKNSEDDEDEAQALLPPTTRRPPGRPKQQCISSDQCADPENKRIHHCERYGVAGHNKKSCRAAI